MIDKNILEDKTIIITTSILKSKLLLFISDNMPITDIKIMTKQELIDDIYFSYSSDILYYMKDKYSLNVDVCNNILNNLYFFDNNNYLNDLKDNKKVNEYKSILLKYRKIVIYNVCLDDILIEKIKSINNNITITTYNTRINELNKSYVIENNTIEDEVVFMFDKVLELLKKSTDINQIKVAISDEEYKNYIDYYSKLYNIKVNMNNNIPLYSYGISKRIMSEYKDNNDIKAIIEKYKYSDNKIIDKIVNIINKYDYTKNIYDVLKYELKNNYISDDKYTNALEIINIDDCYIDENTYLFILGFNQNQMPRIYKDDDYIKDSKKKELHIFTSFDKNIIEKKYLKDLIRKSKETYISYKLRTNYNVYTQSSLLKELDLIYLSHEHKYSISPSKAFDKFMVSKMIDDMYKYGKKNKDLKLLLSSAEDDYGTYDNKFKGLKKETLDKLLKDEVVLSYTSINSFYECKFKYYLKYLLRSKENSTNQTAIFLGNLFHYVLSKIFDEDKKLEELIEEFLRVEEIKLSKKDEVYINKYKNLLYELIEIIKDNNKRSSFKDLYYEKEITLDNDKRIKVKFTGKIDKVLSFNDDTCTYMVVIDYKTGELKKDYNNIVYGLNMQLFTYAYLLDKSKLIDNSKLAGMYLQNIGHELVKKDKKKTKEEQLKDIYSMYGYSIENTELVKKIDNDLSSLKNVRIKQDDTFYSSSLIFNDTIYNKLIDIVDEKINDASNDILDGNFEINPKEINDKNVSCTYCKYYDICYKKYRDIKHLDKMTIEEYELNTEVIK